MPATAEPNLGLNWGWTLGEDGWKAGMDLNMIVAGWLAQGYISVAAKSVSAQPGAPANGEAHILGNAPTGTDWAAWAEDDLALYITGYPNDGGWIKVTPLDGFHVYDRSLNMSWRFSNTKWLPLPDFGLINNQTSVLYEPQLIDTNGVITLDNASAVLNLADDAGVPFPLGAKLTIVNLNAAAATITDDAAVTWVGADPTGSTLAQGDYISIRKIDTDTWLRLV